MNAIKTTRARLTHALTALCRVIKPRSSRTVLTLMRLSAAPDGAGLMLEGTDLETSVKLFVPAEVPAVLEPMTLPAHLLLSLVSACQSELIELTPNGSRLELAGGGFRSRVALSYAPDFPELAFDLGERPLEIRDTALFIRSLERVKHAMARSAVQKVFQGALLTVDDAGVGGWAASDGFRLALGAFAASTLCSSVSGILSLSTVEELCKLVRRDLPLTLSRAENTLTVCQEGLSFSGQLLEGEFPDFQKVIPTHTLLSVSLSASQLEGALARIGILSDRAANSRVELVAHGSQLTLKAGNDYGDSDEVLECQMHAPHQLDALELAFNERYLRDALTQIEGDVMLEFSGPHTPALVRPLEQDGFRAVVVPLRA